MITILRPSPRIAFAIAVVLCPSAFALLASAAEPAHTTLKVDGVDREAMIFAPAGDGASPLALAPVVFVFHGHGGTMFNIARNLHLQTEWPEAIVVYMQGLPIQSKIDPEGKQAGWQHYSGQVGDRDLKFFDAVFAALHKNYYVDDRRIYATGFSNGGAFTYCLWANRPNVFAAVAPMAGLPWPTEPPAVPKPAFIVAGQADPLVPIQSQEAMIARIRELDKAATSKPRQNSDGATLYESSIGAPVETLIHPGGHQLPPNAAKLLADFFRAQPAKK